MLWNWTLSSGFIAKTSSSLIVQVILKSQWPRKILAFWKKSCHLLHSYSKLFINQQVSKCSKMLVRHCISDMIVLNQFIMSGQWYLFHDTFIRVEERRGLFYQPCYWYFSFVNVYPSIAIDTATCGLWNKSPLKQYDLHCDVLSTLLTSCFFKMRCLLVFPQLHSEE